MIAAGILGGVAGLDRTAFGQTLLAHPAVAASLSGALAGVPLEGAWLGLAMTVLAASPLPAGGEKTADWCSVAVALPLAIGEGRAHWVWGLALLLSFPLARLGGWLIDLGRELARRLLHGARSAAKRGDLGALERRHGSMLLLHAVRGAGMSLLVFGVARVVLPLADRQLGGVERELLGMAWAVAPLVGLPSVLLRAKRGSAPGWLVAGLGVGVFFVWWRMGP